MGYKLDRSIYLSELCDVLNLEFKGLDIEIFGVSQSNEVSTNELSFSYDGSQVSDGSAFIVGYEPISTKKCKFGYVVSKNPRLDFIRTLNYLNINNKFSTWDFDAIIHPSVIIGENVVIERGCVIGENSIIEHNVVIQSGTRIGKECRIRVSAFLGGDGFGFERDESGVAVRFPHIGGLLLGDNVEVGAGCSIAKGSLSDTIVESHVKIDNLVHIAHNCIVKRGVIITACAELSGGVIVGENAWLAPNSCINQKISIGAEAIVGLGAVVTKNVDPRSVVAGNPARKLREL